MWLRLQNTDWLLNIPLNCWHHCYGYGSLIASHQVGSAAVIDVTALAEGTLMLGTCTPAVFVLEWMDRWKKWVFCKINGNTCWTAVFSGFVMICFWWKLVILCVCLYVTVCFWWSSVKMSVCVYVMEISQPLSMWWSVFDGVQPVYQHVLCAFYGSLFMMGLCQSLYHM